MIERIPKSAFVAALLLAVAALVYFAYSRPWYFTNESYMTGLIFLEFLLIAIWLFRRIFLPVVLVTFLLAGSNLPVGGGWGTARWAVLGLGALVGSIIMLKDRAQKFGFFHVVALFLVLASVISAAESSFPQVALLKVLSLLLLFMYAATGVRVATFGREERFFHGLLLGCEIFVGVMACFYAVGIEAMGNPNSLGAVMGVVGAPILIWGVLQGGKPSVYWRRLILYGLCIALVFKSHARAGIAAGLLSSAVLCLVSRKYKLLIQGTTVLVMLLAVVGLYRPETFSSLTSSVIYKNKSGTLLASRISPWEAAIDNIREHPWFGMGLGTTATGTDADEEQRLVASSATVTAEHGSSFLATLAGIGIVGGIPFALLLALLVIKIVRTLWGVRTSGNVAHPAAVLAIVMIAGILHAGFEDWMMAAGNYLCVFFWSLAFVFNDVAASSPQWSFHFNPRPTPRVAGGVVPSQ